MNYNEFLDSLSSSYRNLLSRLTSASSELPPGYLYNELIEYINSNPSKLNEIEEYLINKLSRKEPYIKLKCLKLLKHLCIKFPKDFIRSKITQSNIVLDCKNFKSPHSEYLGDNLTKLIRTECEELIKIVCSYNYNINNNFIQSENKMVGFGNNQYNNYNQSGNYTNPVMNNTNYQNPTYNRNQTGYSNTGMMGFGNPNMPQPQNTNTSGFASFANTFTPTVSELKTAGNNALKIISNAANKYLPSDFVEKIEKVSSAITTTATEQFEKYLGNRNPIGRNDHRNLNNSMYSTRGQTNQYTGGFGNTSSIGYNSVHNVNNNNNGYGQSNQVYGSGIGYNSTSYNAPVYNNPQTYTNPQFYAQQPQPYNNPTTYSSSVNYSSSQAFVSQHPVSNSPSFSNSRNTSVGSTYNQGFGAFPTQPSIIQQTSVSNLSHTSSVGSFNPPKEPSLDLFSTNENTVKYSMPGERETAFVREMLTFTGIKVSPSPRLIEDYIIRMKDMDKNLIISELMKHLNIRSSKWQTHFRILCLLESLVLKGNLNDNTLKELKKTGIPIINKCKDEVQLSNKASKLINLLNNTNEISSVDSEQVTDLFNTQISGLSNNTNNSINSNNSSVIGFGNTSSIGSSNSVHNVNNTNEVEDLFNTQDIDLFSNNNNNNLTSTTTLLSTNTSVQTNTGNIVIQDPVDVKVNEFDLFFNNNDTQINSQLQNQNNLQQQLVNTNINVSTNSNYLSGRTEDTLNKNNETNKVDFFDFDNFAFNNTTNINNTSNIVSNNNSINSNNSSVVGFGNTSSIVSSNSVHNVNNTNSINNTSRTNTMENTTNNVNITVDQPLQQVISNIDNNLDLFDNTDFTNFLDKKSDDFFTNTQNNQINNNNTNSNNFDLI